MKKLTSFLFVVLLITGCADNENQLNSLSEDSAKELVENTLISLENYPRKEYINHFNDAVLNAPEFHDLMPQLIQKWNLNNPRNVKVNEVKNGTAEKNNQRIAMVTGTFQCEGVTHVSDFQFTFVFNETNKKWEIIDFKFEGC